MLEQVVVVPEAVAAVAGDLLQAGVLRAGVLRAGVLRRMRRGRAVEAVAVDRLAGVSSSRAATA
jgi:hypothetical protein